MLLENFKAHKYYQEGDTRYYFYYKGEPFSFWSPDDPCDLENNTEKERDEVSEQVFYLSLSRVFYLEGLVGLPFLIGGKYRPKYIKINRKDILINAMRKAQRCPDYYDMIPRYWCPACNGIYLSGLDDCCPHCGAVIATTGHQIASGSKKFPKILSTGTEKHRYYYKTQGSLTYYQGVFRPNTTGKILSLILAIVLLLGGLLLLFLPFLNERLDGRIHMPFLKKNEVYVDDRLEVLSQQEEIILEEKMQELLDDTGIATTFLTVNRGAWEDDYNSLSEYAKDAYYKRFDDEIHLLIVYSSVWGSRKISPQNGSFSWFAGDEVSGLLAEADKYSIILTFAEGMLELDSNAVANEYIREQRPTSGSFKLSDTSMNIIFSILFYIYIIIPFVWLGAYFFKRFYILACYGRKMKWMNYVKCRRCGKEFLKGVMTRCPECQTLISE